MARSSEASFLVRLCRPIRGPSPNALFSVQCADLITLKEIKCNTSTRVINYDCITLRQNSVRFRTWLHRCEGTQCRYQFPIPLVVSNETTCCNNQEYHLLTFVEMQRNIIPFGKGNDTAVPHTYDGDQMQHHTLNATRDQSGFASRRASFNSRKVAALFIMG